MESNFTRYLPSLSALFCANNELTLKNNKNKTINSFFIVFKLFYQRFGYCRSDDEPRPSLHKYKYKYKTLN
ncbi:hypothetical protein GCM10022388_21500 [Flavobacterium chungnamense]|uniref:Uncharacterized protein n=1 Tax=Flavobacterium chungnamense TaxID=706182 RepID=A0ABP7UXF3_9FLAO